MHPYVTHAKGGIYPFSGQFFDRSLQVLVSTRHSDVCTMSTKDSADLLADPAPAAARNKNDLASQEVRSKRTWFHAPRLFFKIWVLGRIRPRTPQGIGQGVEPSRNSVE